MSNTLKEERYDNSSKKAASLTFGELLGIGAKSALGRIKCTYLELLDWGDSNGKDPKKNIVFSLQKSTLTKIETFLRQNFAIESDDVALLVSDTTQKPYEKTGRIVVRLNVQILAAIAEYVHQYPNRKDDISGMYQALYVGEEGYRMLTGDSSKKYSGFYGLRDMFYINPKSIQWYPIVEKTVTIENTEPDSDVDVYEPEKNDLQVKKNNTKTLAMLALAALSLFN